MPTGCPQSRRPATRAPGRWYSRCRWSQTTRCRHQIGIRGWKGWAWPLAAIGTNSIAAYLLTHLWEGFIKQALVTHLSAGIFHIFGAGFEPLLKGAAILLVLWLFLA